MQININEFLEKFNAEYKFLYDSQKYVAGTREAAEAFDKEILPMYPELVKEFCQFRGDFISSDREAAAFAFAFYDIVDNVGGCKGCENGKT